MYFYPYAVRCAAQRRNGSMDGGEVLLVPMPLDGGILVAFVKCIDKLIIKCTRRIAIDGVECDVPSHLCHQINSNILWESVDEICRAQCGTRTHTPNERRQPFEMRINLATGDKRRWRCFFFCGGGEPGQPTNLTTVNSLRSPSRAVRLKRLPVYNSLIFCSPPMSRVVEAERNVKLWMRRNDKCRRQRRTRNIVPNIHFSFLLLPIDIQETAEAFVRIGSNMLSFCAFLSSFSFPYFFFRAKQYNAVDSGFVQNK